MSNQIFLLVLSLLALIPLSLSGTSSSSLEDQVKKSSTSSLGKLQVKAASSSTSVKTKEIEKNSHDFSVTNSVKEGSSVGIKCSYWGKTIKDETLASEGELSWGSEVSTALKHCTCTVSFTGKLAKKFGTTEFDAIDGAHIKEGVEKKEHSDYVAYFWKWFLLGDSIYYYDSKNKEKRFVKIFVKKYEPAGNRRR